MVELILALLVVAQMIALGLLVATFVRVFVAERAPEFVKAEQTREIRKAAPVRPEAVAFDDLEELEY